MHLRYLRSATAQNQDYICLSCRLQSSKPPRSFRKQQQTPKVALSFAQLEDRSNQKPSKPLQHADRSCIDAAEACVVFNGGKTWLRGTVESRSTSTIAGQSIMGAQFHRPRDYWPASIRRCKQRTRWRPRLGQVREYHWTGRVSDPSSPKSCTLLDGKMMQQSPTNSLHVTPNPTFEKPRTIDGNLRITSFRRKYGTYLPKDCHTRVAFQSTYTQLGGSNVDGIGISNVQKKDREADNQGLDLKSLQVQLKSQGLPRPPSSKSTGPNVTKKSSQNPESQKLHKAPKKQSKAEKVRKGLHKAKGSTDPTNASQAVKAKAAKAGDQDLLTQRIERKIQELRKRLDNVAQRPAKHIKKILGSEQKNVTILPIRRVPVNPAPIRNIRSVGIAGNTLKEAVGRRITSIETISATGLELKPLDIERAPVPRLAYGLKRVLYNPGVYQLQDPRSGVYNFEPYLQNIMPVEEFDFKALNQYVTSSKDALLQSIAKAHEKRYIGSTSSMSAMLAHFHFLLSQWRPINVSMLSKGFPDRGMHSFTELQRCPSAIFLKWQDGTYAIDADKQFDSANILSMLGKSMEKLLTLKTEDFERYRKTNPDKVKDEETQMPESFHYSTMGDFLMRSQLDAYDPHLPGTGMFDLKTRAVVSVRMDVQQYEFGTGYQIKSRTGEWESYEREFFDMIRAAFLKYSMQVRMGRMDGIFVAFHNTERIFGFQYVSLPEMDSAVHGQTDTTVGDEEFKLSLSLLNQILNKVTKKFPEKSLRLHFETRESATPFMYIFAEPVTEDQMHEIQSANASKVEEFERRVLGLHQAPSEGTHKWEDIQASVQDAMDQDELSLDESGSESSELSEAHEDRRIFDDDGDDTEDNVEGVSAEEEEDDDLEESEDRDAEEEEEEGEEGDQEVDVESGDEASGDEDGDEDDAAHANEEKAKGKEEESGDKLDADGDQHGQGEAEEANLRTEGEVNISGMEASVAVESAPITSDLLQSQTQPGLEDDASATGTTESAPGDKDTGTNNSGESIASSVSEDKDDKADADFDVRADRPFLEALTTENENQPEPANEIFAMTLTLRNKVNGYYVLRPESLRPDDQWTVEYSLVEVPSQTRAYALYEACQMRRRKKLEQEDKASVARGDEGMLSDYVRALRKLSSQGREWRKEMDEKAKEKPVIVLGREEKDGSRDQE